MAAAFSFGFVGDDIDDDDAAELDKAPKSEHNAATHTTSLPAKRHSLEDLVSNAVMQILVIFRIVWFVDLAALMTCNVTRLSAVGSRH
jgi:hypothetical protein